jgi:hypothetical protein
MLSNIDPMDFVNEILERQKTCKHLNMAFVLPGSGNWVRVCNNCRFVQDMTAEEIEAHEKEIRDSIRRE